MGSASAFRMLRAQRVTGIAKQEARGQTINYSVKKNSFYEEFIQNSFKLN